MTIRKVIIHTDGAAEPNPGPAAIGVIIKSAQGRLIIAISRRIGRATNNQAEYRAVIAALEKAIELGAKQVDIKLDSQLVVRQINGRYRVKNIALKPLYQRVKQLEGRLEGITVTHIPREQNKEADRLANKALDLVASIAPSENCRLVINISQASNEADDIAYLHKLINTLRDFPGKDEVSLQFDNDTKIFKLSLSRIRVNYCPELRKRLVEMVGKKKIRIERI